MTDLFAEALAHHRAGRLQDAERLYRQVLAQDPTHADSIHLLGVIAIQIGQPAIGAAIIREAIAVHGGAADYHSDLGSALQAMERLDEAAASFRTAIEVDPTYAPAHNNLGNLLRRLGRLDEAVACFRHAVASQPDFPEPHFSLAQVLRQQGDLAGAAAGFRQALSLRPAWGEALVGLGDVLRAEGEIGAAANYYCRAIDIQPSLAEAYTGLGNVLRNQGRIDEAVSCHRQAVALRPDLANGHNGLGVALQDDGQVEEAMACYQRALAVDPDHVKAHNNLGAAYQRQGDVEAGIVSHRRAIAIDPDNAEAHNNLACALLLKGDFAEGWQEYEWRWHTEQMANGRRGFTQPCWRGEPMPGTLLIHAEQGLGDTLQFCRYVPLAAARAARIILEVQPPLVRLLRALPGVDMILGRGDQLPDFDLHCPMLSLPLAMKTSMADIPGAGAYLSPDPVARAAWRSRVAALSEGKRTIGLVWAGNPHVNDPLNALVDRRRSIPPDLLAPLAEVAGVRFFSLQKGGPPAPTGLPLVDLMGEVSDFADTAALVANLDLVISVDTAVGHLAGALGRPVWLLNRFDTCWRWLLGRDDSPWYPATRLFRQPAPGQWHPVVEKVKAALAAFARGQRSD